MKTYNVMHVWPKLIHVVFTMYQWMPLPCQIWFCLHHQYVVSCDVMWNFVMSCLYLSQCLKTMINIVIHTSFTLWLPLYLAIFCALMLMHVQPCYCLYPRERNHDIFVILHVCVHLHSIQLCFPLIQKLLDTILDSPQSKP